MDATEIKPLVVQSVTSLCKFKKYYEDAFLKAQRMGLQGEKRIFRLYTDKHYLLVNYLISDCFDAFQLDIERPSDVSVSEISAKDIPSFFKGYLPVIEKEYIELHSLANSLVVAMARNYAKCLYNKCDCLMEDIKYYHRTIMEGDSRNWDSAYIALLLEHQTTRENRHDQTEKKEENSGYKF